MNPFLRFLFLLGFGWTALARGATDLALMQTLITSDHFDSRSTDTEAYTTFTGNVTLEGNNVRLTCDRLDIVVFRSGDTQALIGETGRFKTIVAEGNVRMRQGDREATCARAELFPLEDKIILTGKPTIVDHSNAGVFTGEPLVLYRGERRVFGKNVKITLPALKDLGFDKATPPPTAPGGEAPPGPAR